MSKHSRPTDREIERLKELREPIAPRCSKAISDGATHICSRVHGESCSVYAFPGTKWRLGDCPLADNFLRTAVEQKDPKKTRVGQQKQKKKARRQR